MLQAQGPMRSSDFDNSTFLFHQTVVSVLAQVARDARDLDTWRHTHHISEVGTSPRQQAAQVGPPVCSIATQDTADAACQDGKTPQHIPGVSGQPWSAAVETGTGPRLQMQGTTAGTGRRLARINTRGSNPPTAMSTPATLHDCGASAFDKQTPREMRSRNQGSDSWVLCRDLARKGCLAWPGLPDGSGCREPHVDVDGTRVKSSRAYICARAISERMCTTYTAANSSSAWLPLVNSANPGLLESVLSNAPSLGLGNCPSFLLSGYQHGKLQVRRQTQKNLTSPQGASSTGISDANAKSTEMAAENVGRKECLQQGKETRARAQEKMRSSVESQSVGSGQPGPQSERLENLTQVAIRVFSLPRTDAKAAHISRRASHLAQGSGASEKPPQVTKDALFAPSRHKAYPFLADLFSPVPSAASWCNKCHLTPASEQARAREGSPLAYEQIVEYDSPDEAAMETVSADASRPGPHIPMMTPVLPGT